MPNSANCNAEKVLATIRKRTKEVETVPAIFMVLYICYFKIYILGVDILEAYILGS